MPTIPSLTERLAKRIGIDTTKTLQERLGSKVTYEKPNAQDEAMGKLVPSQHINIIKESAANAGIDVPHMTGLLRHEGGAMDTWRWTRRGDVNKADVGIMQFNTQRGENGEKSTYDIATKLFEEQYGRPFDRTSIDDQILAAGVWIKHLKQEYPGEDISQTMTRYHHGLNTKNTPDGYYDAVKAYSDTIPK